MSAVLKGTSGLVWGCVTEVGGIVQSASINEQCDTKAVRNHEGEEVAKSFYNVNSAYEVVIYYTGATGISAANAAETLTSANFTPAAGLLMVNGVKIDKANEDYVKHTVSCINNPLITS